MPQIAVDAKGNKIRWDESRKEWIPVEKAVNGNGVEIEFDGTKWSPVYKAPAQAPQPGSVKVAPAQQKPRFVGGLEMVGEQPADISSLKDIGQALGSAVSGLAAFPVSTAISAGLMTPKVGGITLPPELAEMVGQSVGGKMTVKTTTPGAQAGAEALGTPFAPFSAAVNAMPDATTRTMMATVMLIFPYAKGLIKGFLAGKIKAGTPLTPKELDAVVKQTPLPKDVMAKVESTRLESPPAPTGNPTADAAALEAFNAAQRARTAATPSDVGAFPKPDIPPVKTGEIPPVKVGPIPGINQTPQQMLVDALKQSKALQPQQKALYRQERGRRVGAFEDIPEGVQGEERLYAKLGILKGELPKVDFEPLTLPKSAKDALQNDIHFSLALEPLERVHAGKALDMMFKGKFPAPNEIKLFNKVFGGELMDALMKRMSTKEQVMYWGGQILNIPRSIMSSFDLSAPLRQGIWLVGRPKEFFGSFKGMFKSFVKEANYSKVMGEIAQRPTYNLMRESGLDVTGVSASLKGMEEPFMGADILERLGAAAQKKWPDVRGKALNLVPRGIRASQRAYTAFLNKLRADYFDTLTNDAKKLGLYDVKEQGGKSTQSLDANPLLSEDIARYVNAATGRGRLPEVISKGSDIINAAFFSPRLISSRLTLLNPGTYIDIPLIGRGTNKFVRHTAWRDLAAFTSTYFAVSGLTAAVLGRGSVGIDPSSSDFGKTIVGNTSVDFMGGIGQYGRTGFQAVMPLLAKLGVIEKAELTSSASGKKTKIGGGYGEKSVRDILTQFITNKQSPIFSLIWDAMGQRSSEGGKIKITKELQERVTPMIVQDLVDIYKDDPNLLKMAVVGMAIVFGSGAQTYPAKQDKSLVDSTKKTRQELFSPQAKGDRVVEELKKQGVNAVLGQKQVNGEPVPDADIERVLKVAEPEVRRIVALYIDSPMYKNATPEQKKKLLQSAVNAGWRTAKIKLEKK